MLICLDWAKSFWIHQIFSSGPGFGPHVTACVCSMAIPGGWFFPLTHLEVCAGVTSGTWHCGTCAWSAAQPPGRVLILAWWISLYMGLSQPGASVMLRLFVLCFTLSNSWVVLFSLFHMVSLVRWLWCDQCLWDVACSFLKTILWMFVQCGILNSQQHLHKALVEDWVSLAWAVLIVSLEKNSELFWSSAKFYLWYYRQMSSLYVSSITLGTLFSSMCTSIPLSCLASAINNVNICTNS